MAILNSGLLGGGGGGSGGTVDSGTLAALTSAINAKSDLGHNHDGIYQPINTTLTNLVALGGTAGFLKKNGASGWVLDTSTYLTANQTITVTGDVTGSGSTSIALTLGTVPINKGGTGATSAANAFNALSPLTTLGDTFYHDGISTVRLAGNTAATKKFHVQTGTGSGSAPPAWDTLVAGDIPNLDWSKITTGKPTTLAGYGISDGLGSSHASDFTLHLTSGQNTWIDAITATAAEVNYLSGVTSGIQGQINGKQDADADLTAIAALAGTSGILKKTAANTWTLDTATYLTSATTVTLSGDISGTGTTAITATLPNIVTAGTNPKITYNAKGQVTAGAALVAADIPSLDWSKITTGKPTTVAGYGITDALATSHASDATLHLTSAQNTWIDAITASSGEVNFLSGVTSSVQSQLDGKQALDGTLTALAGVTTAANKLIYATGSDAFATTDFSALARTLLAQTTTGAMQSTLGIDLSPYLLATEASALYTTLEEIAAAYKEDVQVFNTAGTFTWTKPANARTVDVYILGGSGGGGSGRRGASGTDCFGGGGAGAVPMFTGLGLEADLFGATETVIVGAKGVGGAAVTADSTNGNDGTAGGISKFGTLFQALGGNPGKGGTATSGLGGQTQFIAISSNVGLNGFNANKGGDSGTTTTAGDGTTTGSATGAPYTITAVNGFFSTSSGAGGSITAANVAHAGQASMGLYNQTLQTMPNNGSTGGANTGAAGTVGTVISLGSHRKISTGGGGGGAALAAAAGAGAVPGGGGGASRNGNNSGKGGDGLDGWVIVVTHCG